MNDNTIYDAYGQPMKPKATWFIVLMLVALVLGGVALYTGNAPFTGPLDDWINWTRIESMEAGVVAVSAAMFLIGFIGALQRLFAPAPVRRKSGGKVPLTPAKAVAPAAVAAVATQSTSTADDRALDVPSSETVAAAKVADNRGSLKFDAESLAVQARTVAFEAPASDGTSVPLFDEPPSLDIQSLEPEIFDAHHVEDAAFSDNASDSFFSHTPAARAENAFDADDALTETHGLQVARAVAESAQIIPIRPDMNVIAEAAPAVVTDVPVAVEAAPAAEAVETVEAPVPHDPVEAALLSEAAVVTPQIAPQSDMKAVISSAMSFIAPDHDAVQAQPVETVADVGPAPADAESDIRHAAQVALSAWPDSTRTIAADELKARIAHLYHDAAPMSQQAFQLVATGDLNAAAATLQNQADLLTQAGLRGDAAEVWRAYGALHMGRDDAKAMTAYERVSDLDPMDANIHLYLARRYQMAGDTQRQPVALSRALAVISDPAIRSELLTPFADLKLKAGDHKMAGDALEELSRLHEATATMKPDDVSARSAYAISLAKLAQAREMHGAFDQAGASYKKAYTVFAGLSQQMPDHAGLKAMTDNALRDALRFSMA